MKHAKLAPVLLLGALGLGACVDAPEQSLGPAGGTSLARSTAPTGINVLLNQPVSAAILSDLTAYGTVTKRLDEINAVVLRAELSQLPAIRARSYVSAANPDAERKGSPVDAVAATNFAGGLSTWDLDAVNVTQPGAATRTVPFDGAGVYVGVLDTGLLDTWRQYFPEERIAEEYAAAFGGGGAEQGTVSEQPNKWEHDTDSHGTHVTSSILGYSLGGTAINGTAPRATVIPVKVLNQTGSGWSSVIAEGILHIARLKAGPLAAHPVVINMSLGGSVLDAVEKAAVDFAISTGVIIVASAGNEGAAGMGYPGASAPVNSVAASGWVGEWKGAGNWWYASDVADPTRASDFYIADWSSRAKAGQDLDVAAPGTWIVGPYQVNNGPTSYYYLGGTSMASPHVAGIVALMAQQNPSLTAAAAEARLESTAIALAPGCRDIVDPNVGPTKVCWGADATGHGLTTADAALGLSSGSATGGKKK